MGQPPSNSGGQKGNRWPPDEADFPALVSIPEHELLACIGHGGYGQVWLARNAMGVYRAVKIVFRSTFVSDRPFQRELSGIHKFEPISRLHEGFIDVLQVGINEERGYFYYIMEAADDMVSGQSIDPTKYVPNTLASEISRRGRLSLQECLQLGLGMSHALAELHRHGLVHRDVKPSNVIFVNGVPKLADIGLVAEMREAMTFVGTEGYIPPEGPGTPQADLFSLGKVLYEASTGRDRNEYPTFPTEWTESHEYEGLLELNQIILEACEQGPERRYSSATEMHQDLLVVLNGKSVRRLKLLERRWSRIKRGSGIGAVALVAAAIVLVPIYRERRMAAEAVQHQVTASINYGNRAVDAGDLLGALPAFADALRLDQGRNGAEQDHRMRLGTTLALCPKLTRMWFATNAVRDGEFSPDGERLVLAPYHGDPQVYEISTGKLVAHALGAQPGLRSANYSPDGRLILTTGESTDAFIWTVNSTNPPLRLAHPKTVYCGKFSPDSRHVVTACNDGVARVWNAQTGARELDLLPAHNGSVAGVGFSHDGRLIFTASHDHTARIWYAENGQPATPPLPHPMWVNGAGFSLDDKRLVTVCDDHRARAWDTTTGARIMPDMLHDGVVESVDYSPDGRFIVTASFDGKARLWRAGDLQPVASNPVFRHGESVFHASFSPDGRLILTTCADGSVRIWDLAGAALPPVRKQRVYSRNGSRFAGMEQEHWILCESSNGVPTIPVLTLPSGVDEVRLTFDGSYVLTTSRATAGSDGRGAAVATIGVWSAKTGKQVGPGFSVSAPFTGAALSDDGQYVATYGSNNAQIWNAETGTAISGPLSHPAPITAALFSPGADILVTVGDTVAQGWKVASGQTAFPELQHPLQVMHVEFSRDGRWLVTTWADQALTKCAAQVWDARTGQRFGGLLRHRDGVLWASFDQPGTHLVTASEDFTAKIWDATTGRPLGLPLRHSRQVEAAAFSPGGEWVATASIDNTARIWDAETGDPITPPLQHLQSLWDVTFLPDGRHLVVGCGHDNTFEWSLPSEERTPAEIAELAEFLSGGSEASATSTRRDNEAPSATWERLRVKYPQQFSTSRAEIIRWHEYQAEASESEQDWSATAFHLTNQLRLEPGNEAIQKHLAQIKEKHEHQ